MKKLINLILFILFFSCSKRENNSINTTIFQTPQYVSLDVDKKSTFLDSLNKFTIELPQTVSSVNYLFDLSTEYYYLNQNFKSLDVSRKALLISNSLNDTLLIAKSYNYIGDSYEQDHKDSAFYYYKKAEKLYQIIGNDELIGKMLFNKGYILFYEGNYTESEIEFSKETQHKRAKVCVLRAHKNANTATIPGRATPVTNGWIQNGGTKSRRTIDSQMFAVQSAFWSRRIVTTLGYRRDDIVYLDTTSGRVTDAADPRVTSGQMVLNEVVALPGFNKNTYTADTLTAGGVLHLPHPVLLELGGGEGGGGGGGASPRRELTVSSLTMDDVATLPIPLLMRIAMAAKLDAVLQM